MIGSSWRFGLEPTLVHVDDTDTVAVKITLGPTYPPCTSLRISASTIFHKH